MNAAELTVVVVGTFEMRPVADLATSLRRRGFSVLALESTRLVGLLMARKRLVEISPQTPIVFGGSHDVHTADELACESVRAYEE